MHLKNLFISFNGDKTITEEYHDTGIEQDFAGSNRDGLFITISQQDIDIADGLGSLPVSYHLRDTRTEKKYRSICPVVTTDTRIQAVGKSLWIGTEPSFNADISLKLLLHRDPKRINQVLQNLEKRYVRYGKGEKFVFTDHKHWTSNFHGLAFMLGHLGVADRP